MIKKLGVDFYMNKIKSLIILLVVILSSITLAAVADGIIFEGNIENETEVLSPNTIKVMSYNVKVYDILQSILESEISYEKRYDRLKTRINEEFPDVIGLQEATRFHIEDFTRDFGEYYEFITYYRQGGFENPIVEAFGFKNDEAMPILFKKDKFELVSHGCYWLSDTPDVVGSSTWGAEHIRICPYVKLKIIATGKEFVYYNTHLNWGEAQYKATVLLSELMPGEDPYFITGDFNLRPDSDNYALWADFMIDTRTSPSNMANSATSNGFDGPENDTIIDYCFVDKTHFNLIEHRVLNDDISRFGEGNFASDHYAIISLFEILP